MTLTPEAFAQIYNVAAACVDTAITHAAGLENDAGALQTNAALQLAAAHSAVCDGIEREDFLRKCGVMYEAAQKIVASRTDRS